MMHANKMMLVPYDVTTGRHDEAKVVNALDAEMQKIANNDSLPSDAKLVLYNQMLNRYRHSRQQLEKPYEIEVYETRDAHENDTHVLSLIPKKWRKNAELLLTHVKNNPSMKWSDHGEMIVDGNKIIGSNITDLINDTCRESKIRQPAIGSEVFIKTLLKHNTPRELIVNKQRLDNKKEILMAARPLNSSARSMTWHKL